MASGRTSRFLVSLVRRATSAADGTIDRIPSVPISKRHRSQSRLLSTDATGHVETPVVTKTNPGGGQRDAGAGSAVGAKGEPVKLQICGDVQEEDDEEMEEMLQDGPAGKEWGGPTRGGVLGEPTRFGDWERKGRCSDF